MGTREGLEMGAALGLNSMQSPGFDGFLDASIPVAAAATRLQACGQINAKTARA